MLACPHGFLGNEAVITADNNAASSTLEWKTLALVAICHGTFVVAGLGWQTDLWPLALIALALLAAFHGSLQHETIHGHPTPWPWVNEVLGSLPMIGIFPYRRYRDLHLKHHNDLSLTDPYEDPESYFWPLSHYRTMRPVMRRVFEINNTFVGRLVLGPLLTVWGFFRTELHRLRVNEEGVRKAWLLHIAGLVVLGFLVVGVFQMPVWAYLLGVTYPAMAITSMRTYAEHQAAENVGARSAIVEAGPFLSLLYLNNNLHVVHHASPGTSWCRLPKLYRERRNNFLAANENYLFKGYGEIARRFAFTAKQSVDHPLLYRDAEPEG